MMKRHWAPTASNRCPFVMDMPLCGRPRKPRPLISSHYDIVYLDLILRIILIVMVSM
ncbi:uncharacterized protein P174DRAFT_206029 [Aspergillus novofumigatus IBT 16806]|uniref:Uncharacterized protein n=1 Tax=Aspergillus novofumigatus (strain IBT 16806) TaxID=1392255 RepID=A0A2I1C4U1_ASPN1|nr:uncharacterized protein P174DRAFT_206029 [Aspergillus novofumigatus IBT 16806]PKX92646.1 hypothetical protein P174DRAFT_206029 [Aspergillus novofumigatus IBT 16806]